MHVRVPAGSGVVAVARLCAGGVRGHRSGGTVCVRDSKNVSRPHISVSREEWSRFVGSVTEA
ncbi:DUF397 domain-containing protein [Streptomyces sp. NRRL S-118]|uniref:DUF397 domain-containing protein n=1 Tax=Streptomyces sp. NRRL S-118 TaxID=1463881 RepID=UPI00099B24C8|nr:DUF397 domain-containing protein [Streptomyces sp. NRRL S-118]